VTGVTERDRIAWWPALVARLVFGVLIVVLPFRARFDVLPHPPSSVPAVLNDLVIYSIDLLAVGVVTLWLVARAVDRRPIALGPMALRLPIVALLVLAWVTIPFGIEPAISVAGAIRLTLGILVAVYVVNEVDGLVSIAVPVALMLAVQSVVAIVQTATGGPAGLSAFGEPPLDPSVAGTSVVTLADGSRLLRAYGLTPHPNILGGFLACGTLVLLGVGTSSRAARLAQVAIVALAAGALLVTFSRGAWLGEAAGAAAGLTILGLGGLRPEARRWLGATAVAVVISAGVGWLARDAVAARLGLTAATPATEQRSIDERVEQIRLGWRVVMARPLTGAGASAVPIAMRTLEPDFAYDLYPPHLVALVVAGELGVAGGIAYVCLLGVPWLLLARSRPRWTVELAGASGALAALTVVSLFDDYPWVGGPGRMLGWLVVGLWALAYTRADRTIGTGRDAA
jgi:hypothetical protein